MVHAHIDDLTLEEIANKLGIHYGTLHRLLHGKQAPSIKVATRFCEITGVCFEWLMMGRPPMEYVIHQSDGINIDDLEPHQKTAVITMINAFRK